MSSNEHNARPFHSRTIGTSATHASSLRLTNNALPMAIPYAREYVPPPLPPPQSIPELSAGEDLAWNLGNDPSNADFGRPTSIKPGSSLLGGFYRPSPHVPRAGGFGDRISPIQPRRGSSISTITPPGSSRDVEMLNAPDEEPLARTDQGFQGERRLEQTTLEGSSQAYDKHLLSKIGKPSASRKMSISGSSSLSDSISSASGDTHTRLFAIGEPSTTSNVLPSMSNSPWDGPRRRQNSIRTDDSRVGSYDQLLFAHEDTAMEDAHPSDHAHERSPSSSDDFYTGTKIGGKRRASSPPRDTSRDDRAFSPPEIQRPRHGLPHIVHPSQRYLPVHASVSSTSSVGGSKHGSLTSSLGAASNPSSATSYASVSSLGDTNIRVQRMSPPRRIVSEIEAESIDSPLDRQELPRQDTRNRQPPFICECCPKKPRRFNNEQALKMHEAEKQYICQYCSNRFKNKNEAERHQNSLHLRKHSWSCAALRSPTAAFHASPSDSSFDLCGYCGEEFPSPADWEARNQHLTQLHKFGLCNQSKKFFRADHFRQHLKHSHDGTSGKWTNVLEAACMKDEPPPPLRQVSEITAQDA